MKCNVCPDGSKMGMNGCDKGNEIKCFYSLHQQTRTKPEKKCNSTFFYTTMMKSFLGTNKGYLILSRISYLMML